MAEEESCLCVYCLQGCWRWEGSLRGCIGCRHRPSGAWRWGCGHVKTAAEQAMRWAEVSEQDSWAKGERSVRGRRHWASGKPGPTFTEDRLWTFLELDLRCGLQALRRCAGVAHS